MLLYWYYIHELLRPWVLCGRGGPSAVWSLCDGRFELNTMLSDYSPTMFIDGFNCQQHSILVCFFEHCSQRVIADIGDCLLFPNVDHIFSIKLSAVIIDCDLPGFQPRLLSDTRIIFSLKCRVISQRKRWIVSNVGILFVCVCLDFESLFLPSNFAILKLGFSCTESDVHFVSSG